MGDWRSYDEIADAYDRVWSPRFVIVARQIWAFLSPIPTGRALDVGTGTGIVPRILSEGDTATGLVVGCDRSLGMLRRARTQGAGLRVVAADATALPFRRASFGVDVASELTVEQFLDDRELSSAGRLGRRLLGAEGWRRFRESASGLFHTRFGPLVRYHRGALIVKATRP